LLLIFLTNQFLVPEKRITKYSCAAIGGISVAMVRKGYTVITGIGHTEEVIITASDLIVMFREI
jgi:hypothetical protein